MIRTPKGKRLVAVRSEPDGKGGYIHRPTFVVEAAPPSMTHDPDAFEDQVRETVKSFKRGGVVPAQGNLL